MEMYFEFILFPRELLLETPVVLDLPIQLSRKVMQACIRYFRLVYSAAVRSRYRGTVAGALFYCAR